jgi:hypothetical protein
VQPSNIFFNLRFLLNGKPTTHLAAGEGLYFAFDIPPGSHELIAVFDGNATHAPSVSAPITLTVSEGSPRQQYFAEGATGFFQTKIGILNMGSTEEPVQVDLYPENGTPVTVVFPLGPLQRRTIDVNEHLGPVGGVSARVALEYASCCGQLVATRRMSWGDPIYGSTLESGITHPWTSWYFAEGATNAFSLFYLVHNPGPAAANITLTHLPEGGAAPVVQEEVVPPQSRSTFFINAVPGLERAALSTVITSDVDIVAERAMYLNTSGRLWEGGTAGRGATSLNTTWSFAEGATGFFHTYLLLGNPGPAEASVTVRYQFPDGTVIAKTYPVPGQSRRTVDVNFEDPRLASAAVGMTVTSTVPIVAERAMWWGTPFVEGSVSLGMTSPGRKWGIGEGVDGGATGESTFVLVSNGSGVEGAVRFTVIYDDGTRDERDYTLLANARLTVRVADDFVKARNATFSVIVESLSSSMPITVETAQYQSSSAFGEGGGAASATRVQ